MSTSDFRSQFSALTGAKEPFPWQEELFARFVRGETPSSCDVPTGLGKTSVIAVWIAALGASLLEPAKYKRIPRRLAYIVDRRVVVDQATEEVECLLKRLERAAEDESLAALRPILSVLKAAATVPGDSGLTVSTLRGQFADNHAWHLDASRPAIIVGTVDMIGSRMLFAGYGGVGRNWRSLQAGLLLQDTWIVLDEAHLVPPFASLLTGIERYAGVTQGMPPFGITRMSATLTDDQPLVARGAETKESPLFTKADEENVEVRKRIHAPKTLRFVEIEGLTAASKKGERNAALVARMASEAVTLADGRFPVVVFANTVDLVKAVTAAIEKRLPKELLNRVLPLTGEMRGAEREGLAGSEVLRAFSPNRDRSLKQEPAFLVATACVEVGMDFDADHAVCDAVALERMIQRLGRVNRRGEGKAKIHLLLIDPIAVSGPSEAAKLPPAEATVLTLRNLPPKDDGYNASPAALRALDLTTPLAQSAFSAIPISPPLDGARLDDWSLTSLSPDEFPRPKVSYWLRGVTEDESMTTSLVWRADLVFAAKLEDGKAMIDVIPVAPREIAQVATHRVAALLSALAEKSPAKILAIRSANGDSRGAYMREFEDSAKRLGELVSATVFLPTDVGGILKGVPDSSSEALKETATDVINEKQWRRAVFTQDAGDISASLLLPDGQLELIKDCTTETEARNTIVKYLRDHLPESVVRFEEFVGNLHSRSEDDEEPPDDWKKPRHAVAYFEIADDLATGRDEDIRSLSRKPVTLADHTRVTEAAARSLGEKLGLAPELCEAVALAARWHDRGKDRRWWQAAIGNFNGVALAKSDQPYFDHSRTSGYRHEFGSLIEARAHASLKDHPLRELILHLIAAHHGNARPSFKPQAFDRSVPTPECAVVAAEVPFRFAALQREHGWWALAWLEALVKCADAIASANPDWTAQ